MRELALRLSFPLAVTIFFAGIKWNAEARSVVPGPGCVPWVSEIAQDGRARGPLRFSYTGSSMQIGQRVALTGMIVSGALAAIKITAGMMGHSTAVVAD